MTKFTPEMVWDAVEIYEQETGTPLGLDTLDDRCRFAHMNSKTGAPHRLYLAEVLTRVLNGEKPDPCEEEDK